MFESLRCIENLNNVNELHTTRVFIIRDDGKFITLIRNFANKKVSVRALLLPGGAIDAGETAEIAARREVKEELNVTVSSLVHLTDITMPNKHKDLIAGDTATYHFFKARTNQRPIMAEPDKFDGMVWTDKDEYFRLAAALNIIPADGVTEALAVLGR